MATDERKPMANITPFGLRMQPDLKARVEAAAESNTRSLNAEIVATLEEKFPAPDADIRKMITELLHQLDAAGPEQQGKIRKALAPLWKKAGGVFE